MCLNLLIGVLLKYHKQNNMSTIISKESYQKLINEDILAIHKYMPKNSLERNHIIEILQWSVEKIYGKEKEEVKQEGDVLKKCLIARYDKTIKKPPYLTIPIDKIEVFEPQEDEYGEIFSDRLQGACQRRGYHFKFYTISEDKDYD